MSEASLLVSHWASNGRRLLAASNTAEAAMSPAWYCPTHDAILRSDVVERPAEATQCLHFKDFMAY